MAKRSAAMKSALELPAIAVTPPTVEHLIGQLAQQAQQRRTAQQPRISSDSDDKLLDLEVNGVRCVVTRCATSPRSIPLLSPREQEIARMIMKGHSNKIIAKVLDISIWTVSTHLRRIFAKLGVGTRAAMVAQLLNSGIIENR
jgi:DNA-binding CsgD family transcriptional regulator